MTRDQEIEDFAVASTAAWLERNASKRGFPNQDTIDHFYELAEECAEMALDARDRWRSTRAAQPPPPEPAKRTQKRVDVAVVRNIAHALPANFLYAKAELLRAIGDEPAAEAQLRDRAEAAESRAARLDQMRIAVAAWARDYFRPDDPALAWVLSLLDPVEECGGVVAMGSGSSIAVAAEGKSA